MKSHVATDIATFFNNVVLASRHFDGSMPWWRGHARADWNLHPSLHHKNLAANETNMAGRFSMHARVRHSSIGMGDAASKVFVMQHYGLPTRLLDWTESPLVALYFAVASAGHDDADAIVWGLAPTILNETQIGSRHTIGVGHAQVKKLFEEVWTKPAGTAPNDLCLAINADHIDIRQMVQSSVFTIHGNETPIQNRPKNEQFLYQITIPASAKVTFRQTLDLLHVNELYLFPDLEHLALNIQRTEFSAV